jgi:hypothetical protein
MPPKQRQDHCRKVDARHEYDIVRRAVAPDGAAGLLAPPDKQPARFLDAPGVHHRN